MTNYSAILNATDNLARCVYYDDVDILPTYININFMLGTVLIWPQVNFEYALLTIIFLLFYTHKYVLSYIISRI